VTNIRGKDLLWYNNLQLDSPQLPHLIIIVAVIGFIGLNFFVHIELMTILLFLPRTLFRDLVSRSIYYGTKHVIYLNG